MQLTDQMQAELDSIKKYMNEVTPTRLLIKSEICMSRLTPISRTYMTENTNLLSSRKVRLENFLCETDLKERDH